MRLSSFLGALRKNTYELISARCAARKNYTSITSQVEEDVIPTVVIVGPAPGQAGGISSVMSYLNEKTKTDRDLNIIFLDTMRKARWSIAKFICVAIKAVWIISVSKMASRPVVFHLNVSIAGSTYRKWFMSRLCRLFSTPYIVHLHGGRYPTFFAKSGPITRRLVIALFSSAERTIVLGKIWREYVVEELAVDELRVAIIANGTPLLPSTAILDVDTQKRVRLVFSGRISDQKGVPELLQAADRVYERFQGFELVLMGDSRDEDLLDQVRARPYCILTGWLTHESLIRELALSDIFVLPSHDEGLPMAMIEAMSLAIPVVVTTVGAIPDVIEHGSEGFLVPPGDVEALTAAVDSLVRDGSLREEMGKKAYERWRAELDSVHMARQIRHEWRAALSAKGFG